MLFNSANIEGINEELYDENALIESFIVDDVARMKSDDIKSWCESDEAKALVEANVLRKPTMMRLSKADDAKRRKKIAAYRIAKQRKDPLYTKMLKWRGLWKAASAKILQKYGSKADRDAKAAQKNYIKNYAKNVKAGINKVPSVTR